MNYTIELWWNRLTDKEQALLKEVLYNIPVEELGLKVNDQGEYEREK